MRYRLICVLFFVLLLMCLCGRALNMHKRESVMFPVHSVQLVGGWVDSLPLCRTHRCSFDFHLFRLNHHLVDKRICVYWYRPYPNLQAGQYIKFYFKTYYSHSMQNLRTILSHQCVVRGAVVGALGYRFGAKPCVHCFWLKTRSWIENLISRSVSNQSVAGSLSALTVGARNLLSSHDWQIYQKTGTSHLVAVSGLHCGMVFLLFQRLCFFIVLMFPVHNKLFIPTQAIARLIAFLLITLVYAFLVGLSLPTQRAWLMLMFSIMPGFLFVETPWWRRILLAFLGMLLFNPSDIVQASFWLSYSAVAFLAFVSRSRIGESTRFYDWMKVNLAITIGLMPLTLFYFKRVSLVAPVANVIAVPSVTALIFAWLLAIAIRFPIFT